MLNKFKLMAMAIAIVSLAACSDSKIDENQPTGGNGGGSSKDYNINDKSFSQSNWRNQDKIYIFDQKSTDIKDDNGQTGYNTINLPWSSSVVNTNLPPNFCDAITPENGWELALNLCGDRTFPLANYFALYNKYSGVLRFFYYMPENFTSGNDHMWEIDMTDAMAQRSVYGYGLPLDRQIVNKAALSQTVSNMFVDYVTPYVRNVAPDGKITPNAGWWAFDIDMSLYRPDDNGFGQGQQMSLQMRSWKEDHVSLATAITGTLDGQIKLDQTKDATLSKSKGLLGWIADITGFGSSVSKLLAVGSADAFSWVDAIESGISVAKTGMGLFADFRSEVEGGNKPISQLDTLSKINGTISLNIDASAKTEGTIKSSIPVTGVASPTIHPANFSFFGSSVGNGTWNIKSSPVVYYYNKGGITIGLNHSGYNNKLWSRAYVFDPSSVELVLNPQIFPESDIEWVKVDALCGARLSATSQKASVYRKAFGLDYNYDYNEPIDDGIFPEIIYKDHYQWQVDFLYRSDNKMNTDYYVFKEDKTAAGTESKRYLSGRGVDGYMIEPYAVEELPDLEVNVMVLVKLKSKQNPIVMSRPYLPILKKLDVKSSTDIAALEDKVVKGKAKVGKIERGPIYDYQLKRIHGYKRSADDWFFLPVSTKSEGCYDARPLFETPANYSGESSYGVEISTNQSKTGEWNIEWSYANADEPCGYEMEANLSTDDITYPSSWKLKAKLNAGDDWTVIDEHNNDYWTEGYGSCTYFKLKVQNKSWKYYRLEITEKASSKQLLNINYFRLVY